jgi:hypothetical protein
MTVAIASRSIISPDAAFRLVSQIKLSRWPVRGPLRDHCVATAFVAVPFCAVRAMRNYSRTYPCAVVGIKLVASRDVASCVYDQLLDAKPQRPAHGGCGPDAPRLRALCSVR